MYIEISIKRSKNGCTITSPNGEVREVATRIGLARELGVYLICGDEFELVVDRLRRTGEVTLERNLGKGYQV